jgi:hypothetical protein
LRPDAEALFHAFPGPLLLHERTTSWSLPARERARRELIDLGLRLGKRLEAADRADKARAIYLGVLDFYPDAKPICKALIKEQLSRNDFEGAVDEYGRYERALRAAGDVAAADIRALVAPYLARQAFRHPY